MCDCVNIAGMLEDGPDIDPRRLIEILGLRPHPEGGHYRRVHAAAAEVERNGRLRPVATAIHYLLQRGEYSRWHRVDADETWQWQQGDALALLQFDAAKKRLSRTRLGAGDGETTTCTVSAGVWQAAWPLGGHALVACTVRPGFVWEGFELLDAEDPVAAELLRLDALHP